MRMNVIIKGKEEAVMEDQLEKLLESMNCSDEASLKRALDQFILQGELSDEALEEAVELRLSLGGSDVSRLNCRGRDLARNFLSNRREETMSVGSRISWGKRLLPMATLLVIILGIVAFTRFFGIYSSDIPVQPNSDHPPSSSVSMGPSASSVPVDPSVPPAVSTVPPSSLVPTGPIISYDPNAGYEGEQGEGGAGDPYNTAYDPDFVSIPDPFPQWVPKEEYEEWKESFKNGTRDRSEKNLYTFLKEFNIPKEKVEQFNEYYAQEIVPNDYMISPEMVDAIYSDESAEEIYRRYALPATVVVGTRTYTAEYFVTHSPEEYQKAGITSEKLGEKFALLAEACNTYEQMSTLTKKLGELRELERGQGKKLLPVGIDEMIKEHPLGAAIWLGENSPEEWKREGVSLEKVEENFVAMVYAGENRWQIAAFVAGVKRAKEAAGVQGKLSTRDEPLFAKHPELTLRTIKEGGYSEMREQGITVAMMEEYLYEVLADLEDFKNIGSFLFCLREMQKAEWNLS